jgi:hypothetical protein
MDISKAQQLLAYNCYTVQAIQYVAHLMNLNDRTINWGIIAPLTQHIEALNS